jgi:hypothetical protein
VTSPGASSTNQNQTPGSATTKDTVGNPTVPPIPLYTCSADGTDTTGTGILITQSGSSYTGQVVQWNGGNNTPVGAATNLVMAQDDEQFTFSGSTISLTIAKQGSAVSGSGTSVYGATLKLGSQSIPLQCTGSP